METSSTATNIGAGNVLGAFLPFILAAVLLFAALFLVYWLMRGKQGMKSKGDFFQTVATHVLDQHTNIHLIKYIDRYYVILSSAGAVKVVEKIDDPKEREQIDLKYAESNKSPFSKILNKKVFEDQIKRLDRISD